MRKSRVRLLTSAGTKLFKTFTCFPFFRAEVVTGDLLPLPPVA